MDVICNPWLPTWFAHSCPRLVKTLLLDFENSKPSSVELSPWGFMELFCVSAYLMERNRILNGKRYFCSYCSVWLHLVEHWERKRSLLCIICKSLIDVHAIKKQPCVCLSSGRIKGLSKSAFFLSPFKCFSNLWFQCSVCMGFFFLLPQEGEVASSIQAVHGLSRPGTVSSPQKPESCFIM